MVNPTAHRRCLALKNPLRLGLTWRFAIAAFVTMAVVGLGLSYLLARAITAHALADVRAEARDTVARRVLNQLVATDLDSPMRGQRLFDFDRFVEESVLSERTLHVVVWSRDGRIIYSDNAEQIGLLVGLDEERAEALAGETVSEIPNPGKLDDFGRHGEQLIEVYTPITFPGADEPAGIFEIYQDGAPVAAAIASMQRDGLSGLGAGLGILYLVLLGIVHGGERTIRRQHADLQEAFRKQALAEAARAQLADIVEATPDIVATADTEGRVRYLNRAGRRILGLSPDADLSDRNVLDFFPPPAREMLVREALPCAVATGSWSGESAVLSGESAEIPVSQVVLFHKSHNGSGAFLSAVSRDISDRKQLEDRLLHLANHDPLTGLLNRRRFGEVLETQLAQAEQRGTELALLFFDLDGFKSVNDSAGHFVGNELLASLAGVVKETMGPGDVIGRMGGDEFAILVPESEELQARVTAHRLIQAIRQHEVVAGERAVRVTASVGVAIFPQHGHTAEELFQHADLAMYAAKETRDAARVYTPAMERGAESTARYAWEQCIRDGLEQDRFFLVCQPIRRLNDTAVRYELLLRLRGDDGETIMPAVLLEYAERSGLIHDIDRWVVRHAMRLMDEWRTAGRDVHFSVNLSGRAFSDGELLPLIQRELADTGIDPAHLTFEITETAAITDVNEAVAFITRLRALGFRFAIDDFGVGFASFSYLKHLPVDELKIDGSFIRNLLRDPVDQHLVEAIVEVARGLGKETVAEFVEDRETLDLLTTLGVDSAQGYYIGRPRPVAEMLSEDSQAA